MNVKRDSSRFPEELIPEILQNPVSVHGDI